MWENPQTHHFYDFGIFERVLEPQHQYYLSLETPGHLQKIAEHLLEHFRTIIVVNHEILETHVFDIFRKYERRRMRKIHLTNHGNLGYEINIYKKT